MNNIPITYGLYCPHCGQQTRREWTQPAIGKRPARQSTDCLNEDCFAHYRTLEPAEFMALKDEEEKS